MGLSKDIIIPRPDVARKHKIITRTQVAGLIVEGYWLKGMRAADESVGIIQKAQELTAKTENGMHGLISDPTLVWFLERWPLSGLRMTGMDGRLNSLMVQANKRFKEFAYLLNNHPDLIQTDIGFVRQEVRDSLPAIGLRGRLNTHVFDGHHRLTLAAMDGAKQAISLTAYPPRLSLSL